MTEIISRDNEVYMRIESFKKYEYTNCIAMEMEQRSKGVDPEEILKMYQKNHIVYNKSVTTIHVHNIILSEKCSLHDYIFNIFPSLYDNLLKEIKKNNKNEKEDELREKTLNNPIPVEYIIKEYLNNETTPYKPVIYKNSEGKMEELTKIKLKKIIKKTNYKYIVKPQFGHKIVVATDYKFVSLDYINLALPISELTAYIEKIKNDFDTNKLILDTPSEIMDKNYIDKNKCTSNENIFKRYKKIKVLKRNKEKKYEINTFDILNTSQKAADMFYIYDQVHRSHTKQEILYELIKYHDTFDKDRYDKYLLTAQEYIDNKYYLNLIK